MTPTTLAVIGHVDHGKTALVRALTGIETDRLEEEQARGLSIALGFAYLRADEAICHLIDTPGHADFLRTTASGLSGADTILLVVSARDGVAIQTRDYVKLAGLFGIKRAVVALTKSDLASPHDLETTRSSTQALLQANGITASDFVPCSALMGEGIEALRARLKNLSVPPPAWPKLRQPFLPIDRVFSAAGAGTIVTGTLLGEVIHVQSDLRLDPAEQTVTLRSLQVSGEACDLVEAGHRVAVNLRGIGEIHVRKGDVLCGTDSHPPSTFFDVALELDEALTSDLKHMEHVQVLMGTSAVSAKVRLLRHRGAKQGSDRVYAQLEFAGPQMAYLGQRAVLRRPASSELLGAAIILDPSASKVTRNKEVHLTVLQAIYEQSPAKIAHALSQRDRGCISLVALERCTGQSVKALREDLQAGFTLAGGSFAFAKDALAELEARFLETLDDLQRQRPLRPFVPLSEINRAMSNAPKPLLSHVQDSLSDRNLVAVQGAFIWRTNWGDDNLLSSEQTLRVEAAEAALKARGVAPETGPNAPIKDPDITDIQERLVWMGRALRLHNIGLNQTIILHSEAVEEALSRLRSAFGISADFTTAEARKALETNRKIIVPLLEYFDQIGVTLRKGNLRRIVACSDPSED